MSCCGFRTIWPRIKNVCDDRQLFCCWVGFSRNGGFRLRPLRFSLSSDTRTSILEQTPIPPSRAGADKRIRHRYALWSELPQRKKPLSDTLSPSYRSDTIGKLALRRTPGRTPRWTPALALSCAARLQCFRFRSKTQPTLLSNQGRLTPRGPVLRYRL